MVAQNWEAAQPVEGFLRQIKAHIYNLVYIRKTCIDINYIHILSVIKYIYLKYDLLYAVLSYTSLTLGASQTSENQP